MTDSDPGWAEARAREADTLSDDEPRHLTAVLAELGRAANALSTARYLLADPATADAVTADSSAQALRQMIASHLSALGDKDT